MSPTDEAYERFISSISVRKSKYNPLPWLNLNPSPILQIAEETALRTHHDDRIKKNTRDNQAKNTVARHAVLAESRMMEQSVISGRQVSHVRIHDVDGTVMSKNPFLNVQSCINSLANIYHSLTFRPKITAEIIPPDFEDTPKDPVLTDSEMTT